MLSKCMLNLKIFSYLFLTCFFLSVTNLSASDLTDRRIAIIGAGASGLTAADTLIQRGYENITVYEELGRVGGKVLSTNFNDHTYELGAFWAGDGYEVIENLAEKYGVTFLDEELDYKVQRSVQGPKYELKDYLQENFNALEIASNIYHWMQVQRKFGYLKEAGSFFEPIHPDLTLTFSEFMKLYKIEAFSLSFRPFWIGCGYGYYEETPAIYVLKLMLGALDYSLKDFIGVLLPFGDGYKNGLKKAKGGYQKIWTNLANTLSDVRLNARVDRIKRYTQDGEDKVDILANDQWETYDAVIISTDLSTALNFLDYTDSEYELFSQVKNYRYVTQLFETDGLDYDNSTMIFMDYNATIDQIGKPTAMVNRSFAPDIWVSGQIVPWGRSRKAVDQSLQNDIAELGGNLVKIHQTADWKYFPHVDGNSLRDGFYRKLMDVQGQRGTWYVGGIINFETVESTASYAQKLVKENF